MTGLAELQRSFAAYVTGAASTLPASVASTAGAPAAFRLGVYAEAIELRFAEVLGVDFPGLHALLGSEGFAALARAYASAHPSRHPSIRWFGRHLPAFVAARDPWCVETILAEMAAFEWARSEMIDAADSEHVVSVEEVAAVPPEDWAGIRPCLVPAVRRVLLEWNVPALWSAVESGEEMPPTQRAADPIHWLLWRQGIDTRWRSIETDEAWALDVCASGGDFGDICAGLAEGAEAAAAAMRAAGLLRQWTTDGLLGSV